MITLSKAVHGCHSARELSLETLPLGTILYTLVCMCMYVNMHVWISVCVYMCMYVHVYIYMRAVIRVFMWEYLFIYHADIRVFTWQYLHIYTYTYIHTYYACIHESMCIEASPLHNEAVTCCLVKRVTCCLVKRVTCCLVKRVTCCLGKRVTCCLVKRVTCCLVKRVTCCLVKRLVKFWSILVKRLVKFCLMFGTCLFTASVHMCMHANTYVSIPACLCAYKRAHGSYTEISRFIAYMHTYIQIVHAYIHTYADSMYIWTKNWSYAHQSYISYVRHT